MKRDAFEARLAREQERGRRERLSSPIAFVPVNEDDPPWRPIVVGPASRVEAIR